jgi:hypothetical protein
MAPPRQPREPCTLEITVCEARHVKPDTSAYVWCNIANQSRKSSVATPSGDGAVHWQQSLSITAPSLEAIYNDKLQVSAALL